MQQSVRIGAMLSVALCLQLIVASASANAKVVEVQANRFFNDTGFVAAPGANPIFTVRATGRADLSKLNGSYITDPDGVIQSTPAPDSGAFTFFRDRATPVGVAPAAGNTKNFVPLSPGLPGHLPGAPYGVLVAGFSSKSTPTSFDDFSSAFVAVGAFGRVTAPDAGGRLFLGINDFNNSGGDNSGAYVAQVVPLPGALPLALSGVLALGWLRRRSRRRPA